MSIGFVGCEQLYIGGILMAYSWLLVVEKRRLTLRLRSSNTSLQAQDKSLRLQKND